MSAIKNDYNQLYCHFNKMIKGPRTSFKYPALSEKHVTNVCHLDSTQDSKEISISVASIMQQWL